MNIEDNKIHNVLISGIACSGKTVLASRLAIETYKNAYYVNPNTGKKSHKRIFVLDPKGEWRRMASLVEKGKFKFYSIGNPNFHSLKMNLLRVPVGIKAHNYYDMIVEYLCSAYGLSDRAIPQISSIIYDLYNENGVFENLTDPNWANEHSKNITLADAYNKIKIKIQDAEARGNQHDVEIWQICLTRLEAYNSKRCKENVMFYDKNGMSIDMILDDDDFTVIESCGLACSAQRFFFSLFVNSVYGCARAQGPRGFHENSYETIIIADSEDILGQQSFGRFNEIMDKSASLGLFIWNITQKISSISRTVIANSNLVFVGRTPLEQDIKVVHSILGLDSTSVDSKCEKIIPQLPIGEFLVKAPNCESFEKQSPIYIKFDMLENNIPDNKELENLIQQHKLHKD